MNAYPMLMRCRAHQDNYANNAESPELYQELHQAGMISTEHIEESSGLIPNDQQIFERTQNTQLGSQELEARRFNELFAGRV